MMDAIPQSDQGAALYEQACMAITDSRVCAILDCKAPQMAAFMIQLMLKGKSISEIVDLLPAHAHLATCPLTSTKASDAPSSSNV